jgi:hypothetical protein
MLKCPVCHELRSKLDLAVALSVNATTYLLRLDNDAPHRSAVVAAMGRFKEKLDECQTVYEKHLANHGHNAGLSWRVRYPQRFSLN